MIRTEYFPSHYLFRVFWKPIFSMFHVTLLAENKFSVFPKSVPTFRYTILDSRLPPCNAISEGRPPLNNTSSKAWALPLEVRIENDSDWKFLKSKSVHSFLETTFIHVSCYPVIVSLKYIFGFSKSTHTPR